MAANCRIAAGVLAVWLIMSCSAAADTFTERTTGEVLHGYISGRGAGGTLIVQTLEKGQVELNPAMYSIVRDNHGRRNEVALIRIDGPIDLEYQTRAVIKAIGSASSAGVRFILIEMDTPGGRLDLVKELCAAIDAADCDVVIFVKGGRHGGAISAGAAVALAGSRIYIARNAVIGGATVVAARRDRIVDIQRAVGDDVGEKISSIWRGTMASMAEKQGRSGLMARAMVDRQIAVTEITRNEKRMFVEPQDVQASDVVVKRWNTEGKLVTLTGEEAVNCGMADGIAESREEVLRAMDAMDAKIVEDTTVQAAMEQFELARTRSEMLIRNLNAKFERLQAARTQAAGMRLIREIRADMGALVMLGKANPDLNLDVEAIQAEFARVEAFYNQAVRR